MNNLISEMPDAIAVIGLAVGLVIEQASEQSDE